MQLDWSIPIGTVILIGVQFVAGIVAMLRAFAAIDKSIDFRFNKMELTLNTFKEGDIRELRNSVSQIQSGQDEWTQTLRKRTHDLTNEVNTLKLKVDRLERPGHYPPRGAPDPV